MIDFDKIEPTITNWLQAVSVSAKDKETILHLKENEPKELYDAFYTNLEFGTGGLRGIMGIGTNRINKYTIGIATQGFANYLQEKNQGIEISVIIGYDCRNGSAVFARTAAEVMASNNINVLLFAEMRPTPQLSYLLRHYGCQAGIVCTASHNPKEYNGYKAYWNDGGQLVPPHDKKVIENVNAIPSLDNVKWSNTQQTNRIQKLGEDADQLYVDMILQKSINKKAIAAQHNLHIVYTPIHGTGITLLPRVLRQAGFSNPHIVEEQQESNGNFPTVVFPNPEEKEAMKLGLEKAKKENADLLIGTDPDADRIAVAVKNDEGELIILNGNQLAVLAFNYVLEERAVQTGGKVAPHQMVIKTIVSSPMLDKIAAHYECKCYNVLTGFKWVADLIRRKEKEEKYLIGGEESYGLMWGDECRDKDGISASLLFCELAAVERTRNSHVFNKLLSLYKQHGFYYESLVTVTKEGIEGKEYIENKMNTIRHYAEKNIAGISILKRKDYLKQKCYHVLTGNMEKINLPKSNVLQFELENGALISARPSGTEPKIKFYISVNMAYDANVTYRQNEEAALQKIQLLADALDISNS